MKKRGRLYVISNPKSQVALEFMMTYGWAIMVALVGIGTLAYFGVLDPDKFYPTACTLEPGIGCTDFKIDEGSITLIIRNGKGEDVTISSIIAKNCTGSASGSIKNGDQGVFIIDGCYNKPDSKLVSDLNITLTGESGIEHKKVGRLVGKVETGGTTPPSAPSVPTGLSASAGNGQIYLSWNSPSSDGGEQITNYRVFRGTSSGSESFYNTAGSTGYTDAQAANGQTYYYQVTAVNIVGESNKSNEASTMPCDPGNIVSYGGWSSCSASCGGGTQTRTNVNQCGQNVQETQSCNTQACCDSNVVTSCGSWSSCSTKCGNGLQARNCTDQCGQSIQQTQSCYDNSDASIIASCGSWNSCSLSCGGGTQTRTCTNKCGGSVQQNQSCNTQCCPVNGGWSNWGSWSSLSSCSKSCGSGTQTRTRARTCTNPSPSCGGAGCSGSNTETETQSCNTQGCEEMCGNVIDDDGDGEINEGCSLTFNHFGGPYALDVGQQLEWDFGAQKVVRIIYISVGCNDGETGDYRLTFDESFSIVITARCGHEETINARVAQKLKLEMLSGGGGDNHISFMCCGSNGWGAYTR